MHNLKKNPTGPLILLLVLLTLCLTGCGGKEDKNNEAPGQAAETPADTETPAKTETETGTLASPAETAAGTADTADSEKNPATLDAAANIPGTGDDAAQTEAPKKEPPEGWELTLPKEDWGLFFEHPGSFEQPSGNASPEDLAWYDAYYMGNAEDKVLYLTFDCGYENGNTEP